MNISVNDIRKTSDPVIDSQWLLSALEYVTSLLSLPNGNAEITLIDNETIHKLNYQYRNVDHPTNVLSFSQYEWIEPGKPKSTFQKTGSAYPPVLLGEVLLSCEQIRDDACTADISLYEELFRISIHGLLQLVGYQHTDNPQSDIMKSIENKAMKLFKQSEYSLELK